MSRWRFLLAGFWLALAACTYVCLAREPQPFTTGFSTDLILPSFDYNEADGVILAAYAQVSELLGNHRLQVFGGVGLKSKLPNVYAAYSYLRYRCEFNLSGYASYLYYEDGDATIGEPEEYYYEQGGEAWAAYPLCRYHRVELGAGYARRSKRLDDETFSPYARTFARLAFVRDTSKFNGIKETWGNRVYCDVILGSYDDTDGEEAKSYRTYNLDYRIYRSLPGLIVPAPARRYDRLAARVVAGYGKNLKEPYALGGSDGLRGYDYHCYHGDRLCLAIIDYEFAVAVFHRTVSTWPIARLDHLAVHAFSDVGSVWSAHEDPEARASIGVGATLYFYLLTKAPYSIGLDLAQSLSDADNEPVFLLTFGSLL